MFAYVIHSPKYDREFTILDFIHEPMMLRVYGRICDEEGFEPEIRVGLDDDIIKEALYGNDCALFDTILTMIDERQEHYPWMYHVLFHENDCDAQCLAKQERVNNGERML